MIRIIITCLLLLAYNNIDAQSNVIKQRRYKCFKSFVDSLCRPVDLALNKGELFSYRLKIDSVKDKKRLEIDKSKGLIRQSYFIKTGSDLNDWHDHNCYSLLGIGNKVFSLDTFMCWQDFEYLSKHIISYNNSSFIILKGDPPDNCVGSTCRVAYYPVIGLSKADTALHFFVYTDNVFELKYSDINHDGFLDFLSVEHGFSDDDLKQLSKIDKYYKNWNCPNSECYRITAMTFRNGKWGKVKNKSGNEYLILIKLDRPLDGNSSFELLLSNWAIK
jgi:hypothetical protein